jgi:hypothetical protein
MKKAHELESDLMSPMIFLGSIFRLLIVTSIFYFTIEDWAIRWAVASFLLLIEMYRGRGNIFQLIGKQA